MYKENKKKILKGFIIFSILSIFTWFLFFVSIPGFEDRCNIYLNMEIEQELVDTHLIEHQITCNNYFDGHIVYEYWSGLIAFIIFYFIVIGIIILLIVFG